MTTPKLVEHFFRHECGRLVATLSRRVGVQYIEDVEDAVTANRYRDVACNRAPTPAVKELLRRRLQIGSPS